METSPLRHPPHLFFSLITKFPHKNILYSSFHNTFSAGVHRAKKIVQLCLRVWKETYFTQNSPWLTQTLLRNSWTTWTCTATLCSERDKQEAEFRLEVSTTTKLCADLLSDSGDRVTKGLRLLLTYATDKLVEHSHCTVCTVIWMHTAKPFPDTTGSCWQPANIEAACSSSAS